MTSAQVVETSVTNNSSFPNYTHPDDHTIRTTDTSGFKPFTMLLAEMSHAATRIVLVIFHFTHFIPCILTLFRSTSLTSGLLCDHCLHNQGSRNASRVRSCFDLSLCLLNRTKLNRHNFYFKLIAETVYCKSHISSLSGVLL